MDIGMLWYDNDPKKTLRNKVIQAADYYRQKYGRVPNCCFVNAASVEDLDLGVLQLRTSRHILPGHLWIGIEEKN